MNLVYKRDKVSLSQRAWGGSAGCPGPFARLGWGLRSGSLHCPENKANQLLQSHSATPDFTLSSVLLEDWCNPGIYVLRFSQYKRSNQFLKAQSLPGAQPPSTVQKQRLFRRQKAAVRLGSSLMTYLKKEWQGYWRWRRHPNHNKECLLPLRA